MLVFLIGFFFLVFSEERFFVYFFSVLVNERNGSISQLGELVRFRVFRERLLYYSWVLCFWVSCFLSCVFRLVWSLSISFIVIGRNNYFGIMKWVVVEFYFRWYRFLMQLFLFNTFCLNKFCFWKWVQNSSFFVVVFLFLFLKMFF